MKLPNDFILDLNRSLMAPHDMDLPAPWNLPSRLFRFPIEVSGAAEDGSRRFGLMHPLLTEHPFVQQVRAELGVELDLEGAPDVHGGGKTGDALWWHAVDLISSGHWRELLETRQFTTSGHIADAVVYGLDYSPHNANRGRGHIRPAEAREIMNAIESAEPSDRRAVFRQLAEPQSCRDEDGKVRWPVNSGSASQAATRAWARIFGIEAGWLTYDAPGFLQWSDQGREAYAAGDAATFTEPATGQGAFAF